MEGLLSLLMFAGVFYLMMRFGCGAHLIHGHGAKSNPAGHHKDPVCGMEVDPQSGYGMVLDSTLYRFCSRACLDKFEANPQEYLNSNSFRLSKR